MICYEFKNSQFIPIEGVEHPEVWMAEQFKKIKNGQTGDGHQFLVRFGHHCLAKIYWKKFLRLVGKPPKGMKRSLSNYYNSSHYWYLVVWKNAAPHSVDMDE
jgi:hypothetical protein